MTQELAPIENDKKLTEKQAVFVAKIAEGIAPTDAAALAGYSDPTGDQWRLLQLRHVQNAITAKVQEKISTELLPKAFHGLSKLIASDDTPAATKFNAIKYVIDKAIEIQKANSLSDLIKLNPNEMSIEELEIMVRHSKRIISQELREPVDNEAIEGQAIEIIE